MTTVVVGGALANRPGNGGGAWVRLNWILGLRRLGCRIHFVEELGRAACTDAAGAPAAFAVSVNLAWFRRVTTDFGLGDVTTLVYEGGPETEGLTYPDLLDLAGSADLLVNLGGHVASEPLFSRFRKKVYVDLDPGFTQAWHAAGTGGARLGGHDQYYSVGANVGRPDCPIPSCGVDWRPIRPPVVLDLWPTADAPAAWRFTTVGHWRGPFGPVEIGGQLMGLKVHEFRRFLDLPARTGLALEAALNIHSADAKDREAFRRHAWRLTDPAAVAGDPSAYRDYILGSAAEFSAAQGMYVGTNSGWFSDRTACYLAAGRPALVQDTGFGRTIPVGEGLITFRTPDEAAAGAVRIAQEYDRHCRAARVVAEEYFDSDRVLGRLLKQVEIAA
jgi:hypothetical protein